MRIPRRRRHWRYVSRRRHGAGLLVLVLLMGLVYAFGYVTNDSRVRKEAEGYLSQSTGWRVKIRHAHFSFFGGIELTGVRMTLPDSEVRGNAGETSAAQTPIFTAKRIVMRHRPWDLLRGSLRPLEIICDEPVVTMELKAGKGDQAGDAFGRAGQASGGMPPQFMANLPPIRVRGGILRVVMREDGVRMVPSEADMPSEPLNLTMRQCAPGVYRVVFEQVAAGQDTTIAGSLEYNLMTGKAGAVEGRMPDIAALTRSLPGKYQKWLQQYAIQGKAEFRQVSDGKYGQRYEVDMVGLGLKLPDEQGGLDLAGVSGKLIFDENGVTVHSLQGSLPQAGNSRFTIVGRYSGFEADSPLKLAIEAPAVSFPQTAGLTGQLGHTLRWIQKEYQPSGPFQLAIDIERDAGGRMKIAGRATPNGMAAVLRSFPYPLDGITGTIGFGQHHVTFDRLMGNHDKTAVELSGSAAYKGGGYDLHARSPRAVLDGALRGALPEAFRRQWDRLKPQGAAQVDVNIMRLSSSDKDRVNVTLQLDSEASAEYAGFPYRLERLRGRITIAEGAVVISPDVPLEGGRGDMTFRLTGSVTGGVDSPATDMRVLVRRLELDEALIGAVRASAPQHIARFMDGLKLTGKAHRLDMSLTSDGRGPLKYDMKADIGEATVASDSFPYRLEDVSVNISAKDEIVEISKLTGIRRNLPGGWGIAMPGLAKGGIEALASLRCRTAPGRDILLWFPRASPDTRVSMSGSVDFSKPSQPLVQVDVKASDVVVDDDLLRLLGRQGLQAWRSFRLQGVADLAMRYKTPDDYRLTIDATDMSVRYAAFPYDFHNVVGRCIVEPGKVTLDGVRVSDGLMRGAVSGTVNQGQSRDVGEFVLEASSVLLDWRLLAAMPSSMRPLLSVFKEQGRLDLKFDKMRMSLPKPAAPSAPEFSFAGEVGFHDVAVDVGAGVASFSGRLSGRAHRGQDGFGLDAHASLDTVGGGGTVLKSATFVLSKQPSSDLLTVHDFASKTLGGRVAGSAEITLGDPIQCAVQLDIADIAIADLCALRNKAAATQPRAEGSVSGNLTLKAIVGRPEAYQAEGELYLTKTKIAQVPVMLGMRQTVLLAMPESEYTEGVLRYKLNGTSLLFDEIHLIGAGLSIVGSGKVNLKTEAVRLNFIGRPSGIVPSIDSLDVLSRSLVRGLNEIRITGTIGRPLIRKIPLGSLEDAVRRLTHPGDAGD